MTGAGGAGGAGPPHRGRSAWSEEERREGRDGAREPFNLFIDVLTEHGKKKKEISKSIQTQSTISLIANAKFPTPKTPKNKVKTAQLQKEKQKNQKKVLDKEGREAAFPAEVGREKQRLDAAAASFHKRIEKTPKNTKGGTEEKRRSCGKEKNA